MEFKGSIENIKKHRMITWKFSQEETLKDHQKLLPLQKKIQKDSPIDLQNDPQNNLLKYSKKTPLNQPSKQTFNKTNTNNYK